MSDVRSHVACCSRTVLIGEHDALGRRASRSGTVVDVGRRMSLIVHGRS